MEQLRMTRCESVALTPDPRRVITKAFLPRDDVFPDGSTRIEVTLDRILMMSDDAAAATLGDARDLFAGRHRDIDAVLDRGFDTVARHAAARNSVTLGALNLDRRRLIGAYFTHEYAIEAAALGNPSIVAAPDQTGVADGEQRIVMSLRSIGEGHISSIEFRSGVVTAEPTVRLDEPGAYAITGERRRPVHHKPLFAAKLTDMGAFNEFAVRILADLPDRFTIEELESGIGSLESEGVDRSISGETTRLLHWVASSNYEVSFPSSVELSERVLFPSGPTESHGMEDARFVRFVDDCGTVTYYGTYTAFDGHQILPQLLETSDFTEFRVATLIGHAARNKGIALFPRRIGGRYVALGRHDNVNNFLMFSHDIRVWRDAALIQQPAQPWELMQLGNCGSPIETAAGWLVLTHGVGPFRRYALGALLLDLDDPTVVLGHLTEPLLEPREDEREGYVPNVVYSCGGMIHGGHLVVPYGYADVGARVATIPVDDVVAALLG